MMVLSLFNGMSCGEIALRELGLIPEIYYSSEIDKYAIAQTQLNFPNTIQLGDVTKWSEWPIDWSKIDLLLAGSPCQGFSFAGKQLAFDDPRSKLFFVFVEILNHIKKVNPGVKFLLENVNMKKDHLRVISEYVGVFPVNINSNLVSAQNRDRWYWTNIQTKKVGLFDEVYSDIPQPIDRGILLRDILESEVEEKYFLSDRKIGFNGMRLDGKSNSMRIGGHSSQDNKHNFDLICVSMRGRNPNNPSDRRTGSPTEQRLEPKTDGKTNCLTSVQKDNLVMQINERQQNNFKNGDEKANTFLSTSWKGSQANGMTLIGETRIRRLTPTECARLQTIPAWYRWECSDTQQYRMLGNGWTVEVIRHILSFLK